MKAEILIFAAQEHHQYSQSEAPIIINESHFLSSVLDVQSAGDLQRQRGGAVYPESVDEKRTICWNSLAAVLAHRADLFTSVGAHD